MLPVSPSFLALSHPMREISPVSHEKDTRPGLFPKTRVGIAPDLMQVQDFSEEASGFFL
jgi:hypothetical protein